MKKYTLTNSALIVALALAPIALSPISPADASGTNVSLTITGGSLSISAPISADMGSIESSATGTDLDADLGSVTVTDNRAASSAGWIVAAISTAFTPTSGPTIPASAVSYSAGAVTVTGTVTCSATNQPDLTGAVTVVTGSAITGSNTATWTPTLSVEIPGSRVAGVYTAIVTHSVS